jgi:hypothetical protein
MTSTKQMTKTISNEESKLEKLIILASGFSPFETLSLLGLEKEFYARVKKELNTERFNVVFVPYACGNSIGYSEQWVAYMNEHHIYCDASFLPAINSPKDADTALKLIQNADAVYLGAGHVEPLEKVIKLAGIADALKGKRFILGYSAGANILQERYHTFDIDVEDTKEILQRIREGRPFTEGLETIDDYGDGLGIVGKRIVLVHGKSHYQNDKQLVKIMNEVGTDTEVYRLFENCSLWVTQNGTQTHEFRGDHPIEKIELTPQGDVKITPVYQGNGQIKLKPRILSQELLTPSV